MSGASETTVQDDNVTGLKERKAVAQLQRKNILKGKKKPNTTK